MVNNKIAIIGNGLEGISAQVAKLAAEEEDRLILVDVERPLLYAAPIEIKIPPKLDFYGDREPKPTCNKHHEYVKTGVEEISPNIHRQVWTCRFCGKRL